MATQKQIDYIKSLLTLDNVAASGCIGTAHMDLGATPNMGTVDSWIAGLSVQKASNLIDTLKTKVLKSKILSRIRNSNTARWNPTSELNPDSIPTSEFQDSLFDSAVNDFCDKQGNDPDSFKLAISKLACSSVAPQESFTPTGNKIIFDSNADIRADEYALRNGTLIWKKTISNIDTDIIEWYIPTNLARALLITAAKKMGLTANKAKEYLKAHSNFHGDDVYRIAIEAEL